MVVKPFEMAQPRRGAGGVQVERRRAMARQVDVVRLAQRRDLQKAGDAAAARHVGLQHIDDGRQQAAEIVEVVAVFAGGDVHARPARARPHQRQAVRDRPR